MSPFPLLAALVSAGVDPGSARGLAQGGVGGLAADPGSFVDLELRTETRTRTTASPALGSQSALDVELVPAARLVTRRRAGAFRLDYNPRLLATDLQGGTRVQVLHRAEAAGTVFPDPVWRLGASLRGERGDSELAQAGQRPDGTIEPVARYTMVTRMLGEATLTAYGEPSPRWRVEGSASGRVDGGADTVSRAVLPIQRSTTGTAAASWNATPRDALGVLAASTLSSLDAGPRSRVVSGIGTWRHALDRTWELRAGAGAAWSRTDGDASTLSGVGQVSLAGTGDQGRLRGEGTLRYAPAVHRLTGDVDRRTEGTLSLEWAVTPRVGLGGAAWGAFIPRSGADRAVLGGGTAHVDWQVRRGVALGAGVFGQLQRDPRVSPLPGYQRQLGTFLSMTLYASERAPW